MPGAWSGAHAHIQTPALLSRARVRWYRWSPWACYPFSKAFLPLSRTEQLPCTFPYLFCKPPQVRKQPRGPRIFQVISHLFTCEYLFLFGLPILFLLFFLPNFDASPQRLSMMEGTSLNRVPVFLCLKLLQLGKQNKTNPKNPVKP